MIIVKTRDEYENLVEKIQKIIKKLDLEEFGNPKVYIDYTAFSEKAFPRTIDFIFQISSLKC